MTFTGVDDLSAVKLAQRRLQNDWVGNYAAVQLADGRILVARSDDLGHAEENVVDAVLASGADLSEITRL